VRSINKLWNYREAADYLNVSPGTLRRWVMLRRIPYLKPFGANSRVLFDPDDIKRFVYASRVPARSETEAAVV